MARRGEAWRLWGGPACVGAQGRVGSGGTPRMSSGLPRAWGLTPPVTSMLSSRSVSTRMSQRPGHGRQKPTPTAYAGLTTCLRCDKVFESWDRRQNRLCGACRQAMAERPPGEPPYTIAEPRRLPRRYEDR